MLNGRYFDRKFQIGDILIENSRQFYRKLMENLKISIFYRKNPKLSVLSKKKLKKINILIEENTKV